MLNGSHFCPFLGCYLVGSHIQWSNHCLFEAHYNTSTTVVKLVIITLMPTIMTPTAIFHFQRVVILQTMQHEMPLNL